MTHVCPLLYTLEVFTMAFHLVTGETRSCNDDKIEEHREGKPENICTHMVGIGVDGENTLKCPPPPARSPGTPSTVVRFDYIQLKRLDPQISTFKTSFSSCRRRRRRRPKLEQFICEL